MFAERPGPPARAASPDSRSAAESLTRAVPDTASLLPGDAETDLALRREGVRFTMGFVWPSVPLMWVVVAWMLWPLHAHHQAWPIAAVVGLLSLASGIPRLVLHHRLKTTDLDDPAQLQRMERGTRLAVWAACAMWLIATPLLYPWLDAEQRALHIAMLAGTSALSCFYMSMAGRAGEGLVLSILLPLVVQAALPDTRSPAVLVLALAFLFGLWRVLQAVRRTTVLAIRRGLQADAQNRALREAMARAEAATASKSRFLATMSHEIRTPMNGVLGALNLLSNAPLAADQAKLLEVARHSSERLLDVLNDVLDYSKMEAGHLDLHESAAPLASLAGGVHALFAASADAKGLALRLHLAPGLPGWVRADDQRLRQVLMNLVANALKFTAQGEVVLRLRPAGMRAGQTLIRFEVEDTGIGIAAERMSQLFLPFQQVDQSAQRAFGGSGLGLAISQRLVERMGSRIDVRSAPGQGSCFGFTLQLAQAHPPSAQPAVAPAPAAPMPSGRVLVAEDNTVNLLIAVQMLRDMGLTVLEARDGEEALEVLHRDPVDLVLMDGQMPELDGYAATRAWRAHEQAEGRPRTPIVALTANALPEDVQLALDSGMDDHLAKPYGPAELAARVAQWLPRKTA